MSKELFKNCPLCETRLMYVEDDFNNSKPYLECQVCGARFKLEGFEEKPEELKAE